MALSTAGPLSVVRTGSDSGLFRLVHLALGVLARAGTPQGHEHAQGLVPAHDLLDEVAANGTDVLITGHVLRIITV